MKLLASSFIVALTALFVAPANAAKHSGLKGSAAGKPNHEEAYNFVQHHRSLQTVPPSIQDLCTLCEICAVGGALCNPGAIADFTCSICGQLNGGQSTPAPAPAQNNLCFSENAKVQVLGKGKVSMKDLQLGDLALTSSHKYQPVYAFGHKNTAKDAEFIQIHTNNKHEQPLEITAAHMVFLQGKDDPVPADSVIVGDTLKGLTTDGMAVTKLSKVTRKGIYAPLTTEGSIVVDGVVASSYIALNKGPQLFMSHHDLVHIGLSPYRMLCNGVSPYFCGDTFNNADGMPYFVQFGLFLFQWASEQNPVVHTLIFLSILAVTSVFYVAEMFFGASVVPVALFGAGYLAWMKHPIVSSEKTKMA